MSGGGYFGKLERPTPSSKGVRAIPHKHPAEDEAGCRAESKRVYCRTCGFPCDRATDPSCPFCNTEIYWKGVR